MSVSLISTQILEDGTTGDKASRNWSQITAIAAEGRLELTDSTVTEIARILDGVRLTNGETVFAYVCDEDEEYSQGSYVGSFGPSLLGEDSFRTVRTVLEGLDNSDDAVALFDLVAELGLRIIFAPTDFTPANMHVENWPADTVEINCGEYAMTRLFAALGLGRFNGESASEDIPLDLFEQAVNDNRSMTNVADRLDAFIACAKRNGSTHVYWA